MAASLLNVYRQYFLQLLPPCLQKVAGLPKGVVLDEKQYRAQVIEPAWQFLPLPLRMIGRNKLRWDEFLLAARAEAFTATSDGKVSVRTDLGARLDALVQKKFGQGAAPPAAPAKPSAPAAAPKAPPVAAPVKPAAPVMPVAKPVAPPAPAPPAPVASKSAAPAAVSPTAASTRPLSAIDKSIPVGIDLGTTYSVIAHLDAHGRPTSIPNAAGDIITPSVVLVDDSGPIVGKEAVMAAAMEPEKIADVVKRDMGSKFYKKKVNGEFLPPEVLSSLILRALKADAERKLGKVKFAVITVPAYFDESRRQATVDAGKLAGLQVLDIINEPTAAAIAYGNQLGFLDPTGKSVSNKPLRVLVYDLGGGTFDVTIVEIQGTSFKAIATDGDVALGGKDWDEIIVNYAAEQFIHEHREDPRTNPASLQELWMNAETAKKTLSERPKATMYVNHLGTRMKVDIARGQFEEATAPLLGRTRTTTEIVVRQAGLSWAQIDKVLLVGGSTRMPQVVRVLEELTGKPPERSVAVDEAVAHGAALYAGLLMKQRSPAAGKPEFSVTNINSHSLGIVGVDGSGRRRNQVLIPKNTPLPHTVQRVFKTQKLGQANVVIRVVEGESERPEACIQVGVCTIDNLPPNLPAGTPVQVSYAYQSNGQLQVTGQVVGAKASATTVFQRENALSGEQLQLWSQYVLTTAAGEDE
ncbi:MAG: Hsp70 family protein [Gemmataceae bacterium]|nr:Hsp70 family protein [Gemmataceae bacterium]